MSKLTPIPVGPDIDAVVGERYRLLSVTSYDRRSTVFRARDLHSDHAVNVVVYDDNDRARHEARVSCLQQVRHPGLCSLIDHGWDPPRPYLVFERPVGTSLREYLTQRGRLSVEQFAPWITQLLLAVSHMHTAGLVHRAISPDTVFISGDLGRASVIRLCALHSCRLVGELADAGTLSSQDSLAIRVSEFSPARVEPCDDVFALGILFRAALDLDAGVGNLPISARANLELLLGACLCPAIEVRPTDASEVLERFLDYLPAPTRATPTVSHKTEPRLDAALPNPARHQANGRGLGVTHARPHLVHSVAAAAVGVATLCVLIAIAPTSCVTDTMAAPPSFSAAPTASMTAPPAPDDTLAARADAPLESPVVVAAAAEATTPAPSKTRPKTRTTTRRRRARTRRKRLQARRSAQTSNATPPELMDPGAGHDAPAQPLLSVRRRDNSVFMGVH